MSNIYETDRMSEEDVRETLTSEGISFEEPDLIAIVREYEDIRSDTDSSSEWEADVITAVENVLYKLSEECRNTFAEVRA